MQPYEDAPFSVAFEAVGWGWAKYIVVAGAIKGMTTVLLVNSVGQARYLTHIARTHMTSPCNNRLLYKLGNPLEPPLYLHPLHLHAHNHRLNRSTLLRQGETTPSDRNKHIICLVLILRSSIATTVYWGSSDGWIGLVVSNSIWFLSTLALWLGVPQAKKPSVWGVPLVPWLPSLSIVINLFLLGSINKASFERFGIWTGILLIYYILIGLHASYGPSWNPRLQQDKLIASCEWIF
ncbi:Cationic amino acid transporter 1, partial [Cucurbita argyrosperma subsp. sororia]